jgi:hypothetical protein
MEIVATAPPEDAESALMGCVVCGYTESTHIRIFSCNCHLPIHDVCIPEWRDKGGQCPFCEQEWIVATPMQIQRESRYQNNRCKQVSVCACMLIVCVFTAAAAVSFYLYMHNLMD